MDFLVLSTIATVILAGLDIWRGTNSKLLVAVVFTPLFLKWFGWSNLEFQNWFEVAVPLYTAILMGLIKFAFDFQKGGANDER